jgi:hypothetical protein
MDREQAKDRIVAEVMSVVNDLFSTINGLTDDRELRAVLKTQVAGYVLNEVQRVIREAKNEH